jgi:RNA-binding protein
MIELTPERRRTLRASAHTLRPVVSVSQKGLTDSVLKEIDRCLTSHELIKIRIYDSERERREALLAEIASALDCTPVQHIGNILVVWREKPASEAIQPAVKNKPVVRLTKRQAAEPRRRRVTR